eukprot:4319896-Lingulodinium_polyedra.AAC.1
MAAVKRGVPVGEAVCRGDGKTRRRSAPQRDLRSMDPLSPAHCIDIWVDVARVVIDYGPELYDGLV